MEITEAGVLAYLVLGAAWLSLVCVFIAIVEERLAFKTFYRCVGEARMAGCEEEFMNGLFRYGDFFNLVVPQKGRREIKRVYEETMKRCK